MSTASSRIVVVVGLALLAIAVLPSQAEIVSGSVTATDGFGFLSKFCWDYNPDPSATSPPYENPGQFTIDLSVSGAAPAGVELLLYDDSDNSWPPVYDNLAAQCLDKRSHAKNLDPQKAIFAQYKVVFGANGKWSLTEKIVQRLRPRFWFLVLANCGTPGGIPEVKYNIHFTNPRGSSWDAELGVNIQGLNTLYLAFFFIFTIFLGVHLYGVRVLSKKLHFLHPLVRLFLTVLFLEYFSILLNMIHYSSLAGSGSGLPALDRTSDVLETIARIFFLLLLMLLAKGWTINGDGLTGKGLIVGTAIAFTVVYICILIWKFVAENPAETHVPVVLQVFQTALSVVWLLFAVWFMQAIYQSHKQQDNPVKKKLFKSLAFLYSPWFLALPFVVFLSFALNPWVKDKAVATLQLIFTFMAYVAMAFLQWPSRAEEYFDISTPDTAKGAIDTYEQL